VYPKTQVQLCIVHMVRNSLNYVNWKERKAVAGDLRRVYHAATAEEAKQRLRDFEEQWDAKYASIGKMWRRNWTGIVPFFAYPAEIRRAAYTTNIVESLNMSLRKVIKTRGSFPGEEAALKLLYLALENLSTQGKFGPTMELPVRIRSDRSASTRNRAWAASASSNTLPGSTARRCCYSV